VGCAAGLSFGSGLELGDGEGDALGEGFTVTTPLLHTNFLPLLMHVYVLPEYVSFIPNFVQIAPVFGVAAFTAPMETPTRIKVITNNNDFLFNTRKE